MLVSRTIKRGLVGTSAALLWVWASPAAVAQDPASPDVMQVEEDWVLVLNVPNDSVNCPQFHTIMSPSADLSSRYFQVNWNYREQPDFQAGGLELLNWDGNSLLRNRTFREEQLSTTAETITWTQVLFTTSTHLGFMIGNGTSTTWGEFYTLSWTHTPGSHDLNGYQTSVSKANSWITYGSNRVDLLEIVQVRYYDGNDPPNLI